jgi:hypothetical protein
MTARYSSVIFKATYVEGLEQWCAEDSRVFEKETCTSKEVQQFEITTWSLVCISLLLTIGGVFISQ